MGSRNPNLLALIRRAATTRPDPQRIRVYGQDQTHKIVEGKPVDNLSNIKPISKEEINNGR